MVLPEVSQVPVALVLHETDHLLVWEGREGGRELPGDVGSGLVQSSGLGKLGKGQARAGLQVSHQKNYQRVPRAP